MRGPDSSVIAKWQTRFIMSTLFKNDFRLLRARLNMQENTGVTYKSTMNVTQLSLFLSFHQCRQDCAPMATKPHESECNNEGNFSTLSYLILPKYTDNVV